MNQMTDIKAPIAEEWKQYEAAFAEALHSDNPLLQQVLSYVHKQRGKQLRPLLVLLSAKLVHGINEKSIQTAVALELMHTASLIHDDVVDASPLRRGEEAVHTHWTNKVAVLTGDYMLAKVIDIVAHLRNQQILGIVARIGQALSSGELLQLHDGESMWISEEKYLQIIEQKTACLFAACTEAGAVSSGASMRQQTALREFGKCLGTIFQMQDDVLDFSDSEELGKPTMGDLRDGKATLPILISMQRAEDGERKRIEELVERLTVAEGKERFLIEQEIKSFVLKYDGLGYTRKRMIEYKDKACDWLHGFHDQQTVSALRQILSYAMLRVM